MSSGRKGGGTSRETGRRRARVTPFATLASIVVLAAALLVAFFAGPANAAGATYFVAPTGSGSDCAANSQADPFATIQAALACATDGDVVELAPSGAPYPGVGAISDNVTIEGTGARSVTIDVSGSEPTLTGQMSVAAGAAVTLRGATVDCVTTCGFFFSAVTNEGDLTLDGDLVTGADNVRPAITNKDGASLTILDSTIAGNRIGSSAAAAGIFNEFGAVARIANSTIADNFNSGGLAGGIYDASSTAGSVTLTNDTITGNHAVGPLSAGGVVSGGTGPSIEAENTIIAGNSAENGSPDCTGTLGDAPGGHNILGDATGCSGISGGVNGDLVGVPDPGLLALADNGGPTDTVALQAASPALAAAATTTCQAPPISGLDQRGAPRDGAAGCDIGAYEAVPLLTTTASAAVAIGGSVSDTARLAGGLSPTGTLVFRLYGPDDPSCGGAPVFESGPVTVAGDGGYPSGSFVPAHAGTYRWIADYSGDAENDPLAGLCSDPGESVAVAKARPSLAVSASAGVALGGSLHDTATLAGGHSLSGQITFRAYGPDDPSCSGAPAFTDAKPVAGDGAYVSGSFTPVRAGTYRWTASYSGDADNDSVARACNAAGQTATVLAPKPSTRPSKPIKPTNPSGGPPNSFRLAKPVLNKRRGTATLAVVVPGPGKLRLAGKGIKGLVRKARRAGKVKLTLRPKGKASRRLRRTHRAKVRAVVTYTPTGGVPRTKAKVVRLVKR